MTNTTLPIHAATGLRAVGWRNARHGELGMQPIWPVRGGAEADSDDKPDGESGEDDADSSDSADADDDSDPEGAEKLGDPGKKALDAMKERFRRERARRQAAETERDELRSTKPAAKPSPKPQPAKAEDVVDEPVDPDEIRKQVQAELKAEAAKERVLDKIEVKARDFADPSDAVSLLMREHDINDFLDDGKPDLEAIQEALKELLEKKPYLGAAQGGKNRFQGSAEGGAKPTKPARPKSLNEAVQRRYASQ